MSDSESDGNISSSSSSSSSSSDGESGRITGKRSTPTRLPASLAATRPPGVSLTTRSPMSTRDQRLPISQDTHPPGTSFNELGPIPRRTPTPDIEVSLSESDDDSQPKPVTRKLLTKKLNRPTLDDDSDSDGEISDNDFPVIQTSKIKSKVKDLEEVSDEDLDAIQPNKNDLENVSDDDNFDLTVDDDKPKSPLVSESKLGLDDHGELDYDDEVQQTNVPAGLPLRQDSLLDKDMISCKEPGQITSSQETGTDPTPGTNNDVDGREDVSSDEDEALVTKHTEPGKIKTSRAKKQEEVVLSEEGEVAESGEGSEDGEIGDDGFDDYDLSRARMCRFFLRGGCSYGDSCKFMHYPPGTHHEHSSIPISSEGIALKDLRRRYEVNTETDDITVERDVTPPPAAPPKTETAWERGLRQAKELMKKSKQRKETDPDLKEKRMNLSIDDVSKDLIEKDPYYDQESEPEVEYDDDDPLAEARQSWHGGHYENFEIRYTREMDYSPDRGRSGSPPDRMFRAPRRDMDGPIRTGPRRPPDGPSPVRGGGPRRPMREDSSMTPPPATNKKRGDEWRDPWRRSKSPKMNKRPQRDSVSPSRGRRHSRRASYSSSGSSRSSSSGSSGSSSRSSSSSSESSRGGGGRRPPPYKQRPPHDSFPPARPREAFPNRSRGDFGRRPPFNGPRDRQPPPGRDGPGRNQRFPGRDQRDPRADPQADGRRQRERQLDIPRRPTEGMYSRQKLGDSPPRRPRERRQSEKDEHERQKVPESPKPKRPPAKSDPKKSTVKDAKTLKAERIASKLPLQESPDKMRRKKAESPPPPPPPKPGSKASSKPTKPGPQPSKSEFKAAKAASAKAESDRLAKTEATKKASVKKVAETKAAAQAKQKVSVKPDLAADRGRPKAKPALDTRKRHLSTDSSSSDSSISTVSDSSESSRSADSDDIYRDIKHRRKAVEKSVKTAAAASKPKPGAVQKVPGRPPPAKVAKPGGKPDVRIKAEVRPTRVVTRPETKKPGAVKPASKPVGHVKPLPKAPESPRRDEAKKSSVGAPSYKVASREDPMKAVGAKSSIKLTLVKKTSDKLKRPAEQLVGPPTKKPLYGYADPEKIEKPKPVAKSSVVVPAKKPEPVKVDKVKKSTGSRREELLKQLKAVEDAIARKRSKT